MTKVSKYHSVQFSCSVVSDSLPPHKLQHARPPCPSPTSRVYSNSCPLSWWCHPTISSSVIPFSSRLQSFPASGSFQMSQLFASDGQSIGISASASVLPMTIQDWFPLGWTGWISLQSKGLSRVFSNTRVHSKASILQHSTFFIVQLSHPYMTTGKTIALTRWTFVGNYNVNYSCTCYQWLVEVFAFKKELKIWPQFLLKVLLKMLLVKRLKSWYSLWPCQLASGASHVYVVKLSPRTGAALAVGKEGLASLASSAPLELQILSKYLSSSFLSVLSLHGEFVKSWGKAADRTVLRSSFGDDL